MQKVFSFLFGEVVRPLVIVACVVVLGIEASMHNQVSSLLYAFDIAFVAYFTLEIAYRVIQRKEWRSQNSELLFWFWFDFAVTASCLVALLLPFIEHPILLAVLRILRILRLFRIFSIFKQIRYIEKKILSTIETVVIFGFFSLLIVYVYAVVGMNLFSFQRMGNMNFESLYEAMVSMFVLITNDWADAWRTVRNENTSLPRFIVDFFFFSFIISAVIFTLNAFIAVMTSQIEQRFSTELNKRVKNFEEDIDAIRDEEQKDNWQIEALSNEIREIKEMLKKGKNNRP
jgi:voltage-gated sodium channel